MAKKCAPTYRISIEPVDGTTHLHAAAYQTLAVAKRFVEFIYHNRITGAPIPRTIAIIQNKKIIDVYDGLGWSNDPEVWCE